ncbi:transcription factor IIIC subunit delta N-term-domain-containing protein [Aspergillus pseudotamarii]|uniref:Transcription factor IIIC subunit delta N-term-domain-containing protein n=1 Tax=Aspergillus pseudotamarii TaxID=132259 RepID=A0A5N6SG42_ASPPS|nr:transcription factor IIIC subunit delta N-term-domain-containing protein [Aspergillus pseudotamarii]KAE8133706.1 transcription factor IIIC subunit delta N-term-domain-containing protein [Aspergillus pseudotamarii]
MLGPLELQLFPSCFNCISWSADGEIAVAAGEYVQVLTPKHTTEKEGGNGSGSQAATKNWNVTRIRMNVFTNGEWPIIHPQKRENFSIGPEQSISTVVGLAWSPPGLAKYRRCILAVLTSGLLLSFYDISPQGRWTRVAIVNDCLSSCFKSLDDEELRLRKSNIRSFTWCPPPKVPIAEQHATGYAVPPPESRWGMHLLSVTNDDNDVILLQARRSTDPTSTSLYSFEVLSLTSLHEHTENQNVQPGSIFSSALKNRARVSFMSPGPWIYQPTKESNGVCSAIGNVAITLGTQLKMVKHVITLISDNDQTRSPLKYKARCVSEENTSSYGGLLNSCHLTGPLHWLYTDGSSEIGLAVASFAGMIVLCFTRAAYQGEKAAKKGIQVKELPFYEPTGSDIGTDSPRHWEQTSAMTVALDEASQTPVLHLGTVGGYTATVTLSGIQSNDGLLETPWKKQLDNVREQFDIARDLGGYTISRTWGLASYEGLVVAAFTLHPGDTVEYRTSAEERTTLVFSHANAELTEFDDLAFPYPLPDRSPDALRRQREAALGYILFVEDGDYSRLTLSRKMLYAAACCAIVDSQNDRILSQARNALEWLASSVDVDLSDETAKCSGPGSTIDAKTAEQLEGSGQQIFEQCAICDAGLSWYSAAEAQCAAGHLFVRCGVTFLAIQEPGLSKFCSRCGTEYLSEDLVHDELEHTCRTLSDAFDTCIYCSGKFQA